MRSMREKFPPPPIKKETFKEIVAFWSLRASLFIFVALLCVFVIRFERQGQLHDKEFAVGEPAPRTLFASVEMVYENKKATQILREQAGLTVVPVYRIDAAATAAQIQGLETFFASLQPPLPAPAETTAKETKKLISLDLSKSTTRLLMDKNTVHHIEEKSLALLATFLRNGIFDPTVKQILTESSTRKISSMNTDGKEQIVSVSELSTVKNFKDFAENYLDQAVSKNRSLRNAITEISGFFLKVNTVFDEKETASRQKKTADAVAAVMSTIKKDQLIAQRGMLVNEESMERIHQMQKELAKHKAMNKFWSSFLLVFFAYAILFVYLFLFERKILKNLKSMSLFLFILGLNLFLAKLIFLWPGSSPSLMPTALAPLLLVLLMWPGAAFPAAITMAILMAGLAEMQVDMILSTLLAGICAVFSGFKIRKRAQFLKVGAVIGTAYFLVLLAYKIRSEYPFLESFQTASLGFANGFLITLPLCFLLVPLCEAFFNVMTDITLLELSDLNHPLLKRMIVEAPGTYHHSLVVSTLAESACEAIGANALLARVGCYFHDIGKIAHAEFFTENQALKYGNKHEQFSPRMSSVLIMNHVKDGIDLGKKYKLKDPILKFIPEHQGTGIVYFFYRKALDEAKPGEKINADDFRYPGPKPQSRETAVALLADSTEAASRSLKSPTPENIRQLVRKIINDKFIDGQLDECDLTLRDLHRIQESFVHNLMAIFHTRVSYPAPPPEEADRPDLFEEGQFSKYRYEAGK